MRAPGHLFDFRVGQQTALTGMSRAARPLAEWKADAESWLSSRREPFTADDLVLAVGLPVDKDAVPTNNGIGATINGWQKRDLIRQGGWATSARVSNHGRVLRVWTPV